MTNAEKFQEIFKKFATEVWAFPEKDFLTWLNTEYKEPTTKCDSKFCPDRKAKTTHMETILHCIENECAAYKDGKCLKYNSDQEPTTRNCFGCKYAKDNHNSGTEECHLCMWENQYTPTTKNDLEVDCISRADARRLICRIDRKYRFGISGKAFRDLYNGIDDLPSETPQLSVPEVTALAEWTEKLTEASEDAYNKGYADGMKAQAEPRKGQWIRLGYEMYDGYRCSKCGYVKNLTSNFCPNCGAYMRGEE